MTKLENTDEKGVDSQTQSFLSTPNDDKEEIFFGTTTDDRLFAETLSQSSANNDEEEYFSVSEDHKEVYSTSIDAFIFNSLDPVISSTGDNSLSYSTNGQDLNEEASFFSPGR